MAFGFFKDLFDRFSGKPVDWDELEESLIRADIGVPMTLRIIGELQQSQVKITAKDVVEDMENAGFTRDQISIARRGPEGETEDTMDGEATGATLGGVAGAGAGLLAALGLIAIPGIGPLVAAGVLATTLAGAASGQGQFPAKRRSPNGRAAPDTLRRRPLPIEESSSP